ncbi:MAG TPA: TonB-dependent receptor [Flavipsychrobacter sp.]|nr:TonB-dependent receptor [Flavipsychrobacter sp.]
MFPQRFVLSFLFSTFSVFAFAQDSLKQQNLQPVEIRAVRAGSDAPFAKTEIGKQEIEKNNLGQDLPFLLQYTPSAVVTSDAGAGVGYTGLRIRGTDGTRINVTLNGIPVNDAESQGTFFVNFPDIASSASSMQIQRGVGTSTNGAGAFGATMSISTLEQMKEAGAEGSFSIGSFNTQKYTVKAGTGLLQNGFQFDVRLSKLSSDGYVQRSASDLKSLQLLAGWTLSKKTSLRFMLLTGREKTGQAWNGVAEDSLKTNRRFNELGLMSDGNYYSNQTDNYQQDYYQFFFNHKFNNNLTANVAFFLTRGKGYYEEYKMAEFFSDYGLPYFTRGNDTLQSTDLIRQLWLDNYFYGSVFSLLYEKNKTQLSFGGGYTHYAGDHFGVVKWAEYAVSADHRWYQLDATKKDLNFYTKAQHSIGKLILFGDLQFRHVAYDLNGFRKNPTVQPSVTYNFFNPKVGVTYLLKDDNTQRQKLYASLAVANKEPNRDDFEASTNSLPQPERLNDIEAGYEFNKLRWNFGANLYYMSYKDQLVLTGKINDVGAYTRTNVPESYRAGLEVMGAVKPFKWFTLHANATLSENKIKNLTEFIDNYDEGNQTMINHGTTDIAFSPKFISAAGIIFTPFQNVKSGQKLEIEILNKYVSRQFLDNTSNERRSINAYNINDVRLRYAIRTKTFKEVTAILALNNVFDKKYESNGYTFSYIYGGAFTTQNYYYPQAGFNWLMGLNLKW